MKKLFTFLILALLTGCGDGYIHVGQNGADAAPRNPVLGSSIHLAPGTKLNAHDRVGDNSREYEVKEGQYEGNYVVIQDRDIE